MSNTVTGYKAAQMINESLKQVGLPSIPPQMVYTYLRKGYIPSVIVNEKVRVTVEAVEEWTVGYITKKAEKATVTTEA